MRFHTTILQSGKTAAGIQVPTEIVEALGAGKVPKVRVTIRGYTYRSSVAMVGGVPMVGVSAENRADRIAVAYVTGNFFPMLGVGGGDDVDVDIELDTAPREVTVPADFATALDAEPNARRTFDGLSNSNKSWHVGQVEGAKSDETRQRRIARSLEILSEGRPR